MKGRRALNAALFWLMILLGGAALAPCLILPALLEYEEQRDETLAAQRRNDDLRYRLKVVEKQLAAIEHDTAYRERLARLEFGANPPGVTPIVITPSQSEAPGPSDPPPSESPTPPPAEPPGLARDLLHEYPLAHMFVAPHTRPLIIALGGTMVAAAVILLGLIPTKDPPEDQAQHLSD